MMPPIKQESINGYFVSTVDIRLPDLPGMSAPEWIGNTIGNFETMVFRESDGASLDQVRYQTEQEARAGHEEIAARVRAGEYADKEPG